MACINDGFDNSNLCATKHGKIRVSQWDNPMLRVPKSWSSPHNDIFLVDHIVTNRTE